MASAQDGSAPEDSATTASELQGDQGRTLASPDSSPSAPGSTNLQPAIQSVANHGLQFLSTASNETLAVCAITLGILFYVVFGRVGLVLIGMLGGLLLHAAIEGVTDQEGNERDKGIKSRRELGLDVAARLLDWRQSEKGHAREEIEGSTPTDELSTSANAQLSFTEVPPAVGAALGRLVEAVVRDYVQWWYTPILPLEHSFPSACRRALIRLFLSISAHLSRQRAADTLLDFFINASSVVVVFLSELSGSLRVQTSLALTPEEAVEAYLQDNPESNLANMVDLNQQKRQLKMVANDVLQTFLDPKLYDCEPVRLFLREMFAEVVLEMTVQSCSKPEWINDWIIYLLEEGEPELMNVIDAGVGGAAAHELQHTASRPSLGEGQMSDSQPAEIQSLTSTNGSEMASILSEAEPNLDESKPTKLGSDTTAATSTSGFTTFDQLVLSQGSADFPSTPTDGSPTVPSQLTLLNANITIMDDLGPTDNTKIRIKPTADYILQIEPASNQPGWMITRKYIDFENLHEVLRRISVVSGIVHFSERHSDLPGWKGQTRKALREGLEHYLRDALRYARLAECEGMKRFLAKDQGLAESPSTGATGFGFGFPNPAAFESMGKGMFDVLTSAPKGAAVGGKALLGGVTGVLSGVGSKNQRRPRATSSETMSNVRRAEGASSTTLHRQDSSGHGLQLVKEDKLSLDEDLSKQRHHPLRLRENQSTAAYPNGHTPPNHESPESRLPEEKITLDSSHAPAASKTSISSLSLPSQEELHLPPPPSDIPDDYGSGLEASRISVSSVERPASCSSPRALSASVQLDLNADLPSSEKILGTSSKKSAQTSFRAQTRPITEKETQVIVELLFAVINELYTLSSAWNIRRTLLNAARTYLLRPGNPNLEAIRLLLQESLIDPNTSDAGVAALVDKVRENGLPTEAERNAWPPPPTDEEKENRRRKARKVLVERGMPQALTGIMGAAATGEALGRVFDCLQVEQVARGVVFALLLQGIRALTQ